MNVIFFFFNEYIYFGRLNCAASLNKDKFPAQFDFFKNMVQAETPRYELLSTNTFKVDTVTLTKKKLVIHELSTFFT